MAASAATPAPEGRWWHSFEEDQSRGAVYRPDDFPFPRARGRAAVEFRPDGTFVDWVIGRADANVPREGTWVITPDGHLEVTRHDGSRVAVLRDPGGALVLVG